MSEAFDFNKALAALQNGHDLTGKDGILTPLIKQLTPHILLFYFTNHPNSPVVFSINRDISRVPYFTCLFAYTMFASWTPK